MKYYVFIENDNIIGKGQCECSNLKSVEVSKEVFENIDKYIWNGTDIVINQKYDDMIIQQQKEQRIAELKQYLADTDYIANKLIEAIDDAELHDLKEKYADVLKQRREARARIDELEK